MLPHTVTYRRQLILGTGQSRHRQLSSYRCSGLTRMLKTLPSYFVAKTFRPWHASKPIFGFRHTFDSDYFQKPGAPSPSITSMTVGRKPNHPGARDFRILLNFLGSEAATFPGDASYPDFQKPSALAHHYRNSLSR
jgi:hypothetical protein